MSDKTTLIVPSNIEDIHLYQYQKYLKIVDGVDKEAPEAEDFLAFKILEIFCDVRYDEIRRLPAGVYEYAVGKVLECLKESTPLEKTFWLKGTDGVEIEFGFIPSLDDMTLGEYVDLDGVIGDWDNMHKALAIMYRPIIEKKKDMYLIEEYKDIERYADLMKYAPLNVALGAMLFFYRLGMKLSKHTMSSLLSRTKEEDRTELEKRLLAQSGVGINQFMQSLEETYSSLTPSLSKDFTTV